MVLFGFCHEVAAARMLRATSAAPLANGTTKALVVYIPYFGAPPPWYNLSLLSMALNDDVQWVLIGDKLPSAWPFNVQRRHMTFAQYRERLEHLTNRSLRAWRDITCSGERCGSARLNKVPDTRPFLGALFARTSRRYRWWAWADMDVIWGQLTRFLLLNSTTHDVISPIGDRRTQYRILGTQMTGRCARGAHSPRFASPPRTTTTERRIGRGSALKSSGCRKVGKR